MIFQTKTSGIKVLVANHLDTVTQVAMGEKAYHRHYIYRNPPSRRRQMAR
jgi:hypothetical protein